MVPSAHPSPQPKQHLDRFSWFCTAHDCDNRPTNRPCYSVSNSRLHVRTYTVMRSNNNKIMIIQYLYGALKSDERDALVVQKKNRFLETICSNLFQELVFCLYSSATGNSSVPVNRSVLASNQTLLAAVPTFCKTQWQSNLQHQEFRTLSFILCQASFEYRTFVHCACDWFCGSSGCGSTGLSVDGMLMRSWSISYRTSSYEKYTKILSATSNK